MFRLKQVYPIVGAQIAECYFPALKKAAEGHFEDLTVTLSGNYEIRFLKRGRGSNAVTTMTADERKLLGAWFQGWMVGFFLGDRSGIDDRLDKEADQWAAEFEQDKLLGRW